MKKLPVALGLLLIFVGVIMATSYNSSIANPEWKTEAEVDNNWSISGNFSLGDNMTLVIAWSAITGGEDFGELPTNVTITADNGDTTDFAVYFLTNPNIPPGQEGERQQIYVSRIELLGNIGDSLAPDDPPRQIGGIVKRSGAFEARVHPPQSFQWAGYPEPEPPTALRLLRIRINTTYPYRYLLPAGAVTSVLGGAVMLVWRDRPNRRGSTRAKKLSARKP